ncbi:unnamed protein product, partial [Rotaria socialis]
YSGFENFSEAYNDEIESFLLQHSDENDSQVKNRAMLERRLFENIWLIYSTSLLKLVLSTVQEIEIPLNISDRVQRNSFFISQLNCLEHDFTSFWSSHSSNFSCGSQCCKALVIDDFQKPDRFVCHYAQELTHSEKLGDIEWGCGIRPEIIKDKIHPGYWINTKYCPEPIHLENIQSTETSIDKDDYDSIDCNVSRRLPKYLIYGNACGLLLTFQKRFQNGQIRNTNKTAALYVNFTIY